VGYSLVGLYAALERGWSGVQVRDLHQRMGKPDRSWPVFVAPSHSGALTIADVAWRAWSAQHSAVADFSARFGVTATS
jgi:hypothetical protein